MHLSILSDSFLSDSLADARSVAVDPPVRRPGLEHRDGVARGVVVLVIAVSLIAVAMLAGIGQNAAADEVVVSFSQSASALNGMNHHELRGSREGAR